MISRLRLRSRTDTTRGQPRLPGPWAVRLTRLGLWSLVALGALGGLVAAVRPTTTVIQPAGDRPEPVPTGVAGVAEVAARRWLSHASPIAGRAVAPAVRVDDTTALHVRRLGDDYWAVTVAAAVRTPAMAESRLWYLEVGVARAAGQLRPVGDPAVVPPPADPTPLAAASASLTHPSPDDPVVATAEAFLRALLAGGGDPVRYIAPGTAIAAATEAPFRELSVARAGVLAERPGARRLRVAVTAATADGVAVDMTYELDLAERDGRWEITALAGAPSRPAALEPSTSSSAPASSPVSTTQAPAPGA